MQRGKRLEACDFNGLPDACSTGGDMGWLIVVDTGQSLEVPCVYPEHKERVALVIVVFADVRVVTKLFRTCKQECCQNVDNLVVVLNCLLAILLGSR